MFFSIIQFIFTIPVHLSVLCFSHYSNFLHNIQYPWKRNGRLTLFEMEEIIWMRLVVFNYYLYPIFILICAYLCNILLYFLIKIINFFSFFLEIGFSHVFNFGDSCNNCLILVTSFSYKILQTLSLTSDHSIANNPFWFTSFSANVHIFWEIRSLSAPWRKPHWKPTMNHFHPHKYLGCFPASSPVVIFFSVILIPYCCCSSFGPLALCL